MTGGDLNLALTGGDDYELLFCTRTALSAATLGRRLGVPVTRIGRIVKRRGARLFADGRLISDGKVLSDKRLVAESPVAGTPRARTSIRNVQLKLAGWDQLRDGRN